MARRGRQRAKPSAGNAPVAAYLNIENRLPRAGVFDADGVAAIHEAALDLLERIGIRVLLPEGLAVFEKAGARVDADMVFLGRDIVEAALQTAPSSFTIHARNPDRSLQVDQSNVFFTAGGGCPNITDRINGRRPGSMADFETVIRLQQQFDVLAKLAPSVEPQDVPVNLRHLDMMAAQLTHSDKVPFIYARGRAQVEDGFEALRLALGFDDETFRSTPATFTVINSNSPRQLDRPMTQGIIDFARFGQPSVITPFCLAGAMAPITVAGALTLSHAEALAGVTLAQLVRPGAPVVYGAFTSNVDMKSGAPVFGTPEHIQAAIGSGQLARHVDLPWRGAAGTAGNTTDSQSATETQLALWGGLLGGASFLYHAAGWLEGGLTMGLEKMICDLEALQIIARAMQPVGISEEDIALEAIAGVAPGGHFFDSPHTMSRYADAFYEPLVADWSNHGQWQESGAERADERATAIWQQKMEAATPPPFNSPSRDAALDFIEQRKAAGGAAAID